MADKLKPLAYSTKEAAQLLSISRPTLYKLMQDPLFPKFKAGTRTLIPAEPLEAWVQAQVERGESA